MMQKSLIEVYFQNRSVGKLCLEFNNHISFEYDSNWIIEGFSISPFSLPLREGQFTPDNPFTFHGLFGVFADSLPDGWGNLLTDLMLKQKQCDLASIGILDRFGLIGSIHLGGLEYRPVNLLDSNNNGLSIDEIAKQSTDLYQTDQCLHLDDLYIHAGSCAGAQPKANWSINNEPWIVKFPSSYKRKSDGLMEYEYMACAKSCGINVADFRLLSSDWCDGYFAVKRFDRDNGLKRHMISVSALLETSHRIPNLDYLVIFKVIRLLNGQTSEMEEMYRRMCFNVFAHNRDDHSKNFSFLYDANQKKYVLSPAYDLTYSNSIGGEHATTINGVGDQPNLNDLLNVARKVGLKEIWAKRTAVAIKDKVDHQLSRWLNR